MELIAENRAVIATLAGVLALLVLVLRAKLNAFVALMTIAILCALAAGLAPGQAYETVISGMGGTLGFIAPVIGLGAVFGVLLECSGAITSLARATARSGGANRQSWMMGGLGLTAATPVFFDVALIVFMPFVRGLAARAGRATLFFGLPLCAGLAAGHAFIPPTPGPIAIAELIGADLGWVIIFGIGIGAVSVALAGPILVWVLERWRALPAGATAEPSPREVGPALDEAAGVSFPVAAGLIALPLALILIGTLAGSFLQPGFVRDIAAVIGHPFAALIIACGAVYAVVRPRDEAGKARVRGGLARAFEPTGAVILVTGAGGAFKQVLVDTGAGADLATMVLTFGLTPLLAGFVLALLVRVAQGSATVAMITAAGLAAPIVAAADPTQAQLGLITIAIAAGATGFSHVNDSGFWLVNRLFGLSEAETLRTWTLSTTIIAVTGLVMACLVYVIM